MKKEHKDISIGDLASCVCFKDCQVIHASNDGMEILGHFLLTQVASDRNHFFEQWIKSDDNRAVKAGPYLLEKSSDTVYLSHLDFADVMPFYCLKKNLLEILHKWHGYCASDQFSACSIGGKDVIISRDTNQSDEDTFFFSADKVH